MNDNIITFKNVYKQYDLGVIGTGTLQGDIQSAWAKMRGKEDPNSKITASGKTKNERFFALKDISFDVKKGQRVGIIGRNGAGKSTLLKLLSRVTAPTSGAIAYNGRITSMLEIGTGFHRELTGRENVFLNGAILGMSKAEIAAKMDDIIEFSEIEKFIDTPVKRYSSGMYVKLAFSVAAHLDSEIMIMDEVLAVGDVAFQQKCLAKMDEISKTDGRTILYVSHNMNTIRQMCDRVIVLKDGEIIYDGDVERGIEEYFKNDMQLPPYVDLSDSPRALKTLENDLKITSLEFTDCKKAKFNAKEPIKFKVNFSAKKDYKNMHILFELKSLDGYSLAAAPSGCFGDILKGECQKEFSVDLSSASAGKYQIYLAAFTYDRYGVPKCIDRPRQPVNIQIITDKDEKRWLAQSWGRIKLPDLTCED
ncbi:MAG: ABC transporter ATP-binding protein [Oscillospiraceae bacterium]|nr:ABC transporter ATP-binding protein [Candidatus Equicaccousia limihippi]